MVWVVECFFWSQPTRVVPGQRPLNGCVCVCCIMMLLIRRSSSARRKPCQWPSIRTRPPEWKIPGSTSPSSRPDTPTWTRTTVRHHSTSPATPVPAIPPILAVRNQSPLAARSMMTRPRSRVDGQRRERRPSRQLRPRLMSNRQWFLAAAVSLFCSVHTRTTRILMFFDIFIFFYLFNFIFLLLIDLMHRVTAAPNQDNLRRWARAMASCCRPSWTISVLN